MGTRRPTPEAVAFTEVLAAEVADAGLVVFSGGALGIDSAAHRGALNAGGTTVVVAPAGFLAAYPEENRDLFGSILDAGGAYLSLVPDDQPAHPSAFFPRNACLVALSELVLLVEAPVRSGARNATSWARRLGRPVLVVPSAPWNPSGAGSLLELRLGAGLCTSVRDVFDTLERVLLHPLPRARSLETAPAQEELPFNDAPAPVPAARPSSVPQDEKERVCTAVASGASDLDGICEGTGLSPQVVQKHVLTLTLEGALAPDPSGRLRLTPLSKMVSGS